MSHIYIPHSHISLTSSEELKQICRPIFNLLNIGYFAFHRIHDDGSIIRLSTYPEWTLQYVTQNYFGHVRLDQFPFTDNAYQYHLWTHYPKQDPAALLVIQDSYQNFNLKNGFSVIKNCGRHSDQYIFAATQDVKDFDESIYLTMIESIEKWTAYFLTKACDLIAKAEKEKLTPKLLLPENFKDYENERKKFINSAIPGSMNIEVNGQKIRFSKREFDCLAAISKGKTVKRIAKDLSLSPRTIETYVNLIKRKTQCSTINEVIEKVIDFDPLRYILFNYTSSE